MFLRERYEHVAAERLRRAARQPGDVIDREYQNDQTPTDATPPSRRETRRPRALRLP
jgi:hypothetical protein